MATSSILGGDRAALQPSGRSAELLGPSDSSDTGSDALGTDELHADSDASGSGERAAVGGTDALDGADILPDRIVRLGEGDEFSEDVDGMDDTELTEAVTDELAGDLVDPEADETGEEDDDTDDTAGR